MMICSFGLSLTFRARAGLRLSRPARAMCASWDGEFWWCRGLGRAGEAPMLCGRSCRDPFRLSLTLGKREADAGLAKLFEYPGVSALFCKPSEEIGDSRVRPGHQSSRCRFMFF